MRFSPEYVHCVLNENFEDAKAQFLAPLMAIHYAHLVMLTERGIIPPRDARTIRTGLDAISLDDVRRARYDEVCEDLFFYLERLIVEACGEEAAGRLHTARSRNDIDMTMYRMQQRELILVVMEGTLRLRRVLVDLAAQHRETVFAAHTHTQPAQPSTIAHYLMAVSEQLERDTVRLRAAFLSANQCPLGSCAITGTGFPIDRDRTAALLGFDAATGNTYGSIATVDYLLESVSATAVLLAGLGRVVQDLLLWCTAEFGYLRLADGFVQGSSIMPQKRNPAALEHARAIGSKALGQASAILLSVHNTPFGDIVDTEDDLQPLVFAMFRDASRAVRLVAAALAGAEFNRARLAERARQNWITVTELADTLARERGVPFKMAHGIAATFVAAASAQPGTSLSAVLREISEQMLGTPIEYTEEALAETLSPDHFIRVRTTPGGPAPAEMTRAIDRSRLAQARDESWFEQTAGKLRAAEHALRQSAAAL
jgi:argininosuccinate lyase